jgi:hypothetical protein
MGPPPPNDPAAPGPPGHARRRRLRLARLRAALLALVFVVQGTAAYPFPPLSPERLARPDAKRELDRWAARLNRVGLRRSPDELGAEAVALTGRLDAARARLLAPFRPFFDLTRTDQRWGLFLDAHATRYRMHVEAQEASGAWTLRYRPLDPDARALADRLEYRRVRAAWNPRSQATREPYKPFASWVARELFAREPGLRAVRVRMERFRIPRPGEAPDPETSWPFEEVRHRTLPGAR